MGSGIRNQLFSVFPSLCPYMETIIDNLAPAGISFSPYFIHPYIMGTIIADLAPGII